jgi:hypothetical protein
MAGVQVWEIAEWQSLPNCAPPVVQHCSLKNAQQKGRHSRHRTGGREEAAEHPHHQNYTQAHASRTEKVQNVSRHRTTACRVNTTSIAG